MLSNDSERKAFKAGSTLVLHLVASRLQVCCDSQYNFEINASYWLSQQTCDWYATNVKTDLKNQFINGSLDPLLLSPFIPLNLVPHPFLPPHSTLITELLIPPVLLEKFY